MKIKIFIGSTSEIRPFVTALVTSLGSDYEIKPWFQGVFELSGNTQSSLVNEISSCDFSIFVLSADDATKSRGKEFLSPRDNVVFEAGMSFGALNSSRTFLIPEKTINFKMPSDLNGFTTTSSFDRNDNPAAAMLLPAAEIAQRIKELGRRPTREYKGGHEVLIREANDLLATAEHSIVLFGRDLSWASAYSETIKNRVSAGVVVEVFSDEDSKQKARKNAQILIKAGAKVHYCKRDPSIKLSLIDHKKATECLFMISFKERNPAHNRSDDKSDAFIYQYTLYDAKHATALWLTLVRLYDSLVSESAEILARKKSSKLITGEKVTRSVKK